MGAFAMHRYTIYDIVNASCSVSYKIIEGSYFSSNTVVIIAQLTWKQFFLAIPVILP
jgi:hypothetical protein